MRRTSRALPEHGVDLGSRLGLPRLGLLELGVGLADEPPGGLEGPGWVGLRPRPAVASASTWAATPASRLLGSGAGPTPPHLEPTTVATRDSRLPRLLARSVL